MPASYMTFDAHDFMSSSNAENRVYPKEVKEARETNFLARKWHSAPVAYGDSPVMVVYGE